MPPKLNFPTTMLPAITKHLRHAARPAAVLALLLVAMPAFAQGRGPNAQPPQGQPFQQMQAQLDALAERLDAVEAENEALQSEVAALHEANDALLDEVENAIAALADDPIFALSPYISIEEGELYHLRGPHVLFTGVNVHIRNGQEFTWHPGPDREGAGLGNLIVGYNEPPSLPLNDPGAAPVEIPLEFQPERDGWHNLIVGMQHEFTAVGGLVAGQHNMIAGNHTSVTGGTNNVAYRHRASVSGGDGNRAYAQGSTVTGGADNVVGVVDPNDPNDFTYGINASISGGRGNLVLGDGASIGGGENNLASGYWSSVSGGLGREALGSHNWAAGDLFEAD